MVIKTRRTLRGSYTFIYTLLVMIAIFSTFVSVLITRSVTGQLATLKARLVDIMEAEHDSIRFYYLGKNWHRRVERLGAKETYDVDGYLGI